MKNFNIKILIESNASLEYEDREKLKSDGWQKYHFGENTEEKAEGLEMVIFGHFARSYEASHGIHPDFPIYAQHWLNANGDRYDKDVIDLLYEKYGRHKGKAMIPPHYSYWEKNWELNPCFRHLAKKKK